MTGTTGAAFFEPPSAPPELLPTMVGASVHRFRYSTFVRETDHRGIAVRYDAGCGILYNPTAPEQPHPLLGIFTENACPVLHLGYLSSHQQRWLSQGTALGEVVYSLSLAPGESRNIAVIDLRRRQQGRRQEQTDATEELLSSQDHTFALQEVAAAVALEHQHGKTSVEASTLVTAGAFVAAGALVGGIGGGIIGTMVKPGLGTVIGAGVGAGAGAAAGGLVFAGAQALGKIEAESSGDRDVMAQTNQRIAQATSQQSALIRSLWSTVVTEDVQEERFEARTSNITNYNHMHALNMQYYEVLHRYRTVTDVDRVTPLLYLPFAALPLQQVQLIDEFWDSIRTGLPKALRDRGDRVFVDPPPPPFVPEPVPPTPDAPAPLITAGFVDLSTTLATLAYYEQLRIIAEIEQRNADGAAAHQAVLGQLDAWRQQVIEAVQREPYRFTRIILSSMETGRLTWILDRLTLRGDDPDELGSFPLHAVAHTTPIGIADDSVVLKMKHFDLEQAQQTAPQIIQLDAESWYDMRRVLGWHRIIATRFAELGDLTVEDEVVLPGAGVFAEAVLGRSNASEYIDPDRYWNWQDSPIPHQAPQILPVSTDPRTTAPLPTDPTVPDANLPLVSAPSFPAPTGLAGVIQAIQNGSMFRDMSKADQLAGVLRGLADLAGETAKSAATMTGDAASNALSSATDIGKSVASMTEKLMSHAPPQAAAAPGNPTTASAAGTAVERSQGKPSDVTQAVKDAWGVPGPGGVGSAGTGGTGPVTPGTGAPAIPSGPPPWRPLIDHSATGGPGQVSRIPPAPPPIQNDVEAQLVDALNAAAADTGTMPDTSDMIAPLEHWYRDSVVPLLIYARHNEAYLTSAINQYLDWLATMRQLDLDAEAEQMADLHGDGRTLIRYGLENAIVSGFGQMEANNDLDYLTDVLNWSGTAALLGFDDSDSSLFDTNSLNEHNPIRVVLSGPLEPDGTLADGASYDLNVTGGLAIGDNPPLVGRVVAVTVTVDNGSVVPAQGSIHPGLALAASITRTGSTPMTVTVKGHAELLQGAWLFETTRTVTIG